MIERGYEELMQDVLDRQATPEQTAELHHWLAANPAGQARFEELEALFWSLGEVREVAAPTVLKEGIMRALRARAPAASPAPTRSRRPGFVLRPAFMFVAGLAAGAISYGALTNLPAWPPGENPAAGSMMPSPGAAPGSKVIRRSWSVGSSRVEAISWQRAGAPVVAFRIHGETSLEIEYPAETLAIRAISQTRAGASQVRSEPGRVLISATDRSEFELELEPGGPPLPLHVTLRAGSSVVGGDLPLEIPR